MKKSAERGCFELEANRVTTRGQKGGKNAPQVNGPGWRVVPQLLCSSSDELRNNGDQDQQGVVIPKICTRMLLQRGLDRLLHLEFPGTY